MTTNTMKRLAVGATCALLLAAASGCGGETEDTEPTPTNAAPTTGTAANSSGSASGKGLPAGVPPDAAPRR